MTTLNIGESKKVEKVARKTVTVRVPVETHKKFKAIAKFGNEPMQKILAEFIETYVAENFDENLHDTSENADDNGDD